MMSRSRQDRFDAQFVTLKTIIEGTKNAPELQGYAVLQKLLSQVLDFAEGYKVYFGQQGEVSFRELNLALTRLQEEWLRISRACDQRCLKSFHGLQPVLDKADAIAAGLYKRYWGYKPANDIAPITYIEKSFEITRYVFSPYPLISVPLLFTDPQEENAMKQSIAHEIGHFIYWNAAPLHESAALHKGLLNAVLNNLVTSATADVTTLQKWHQWDQLTHGWETWLEEACADVIGALFGGLDYLESAITIAEELDYEELIYDDGEHPCYYLRPWIASETLRWLIGKNQNRPQQVLGAEDASIADAITRVNELVEKWTDFLKDKRVLDSAIQGIALDTIIASVRKVVTTLLEFESELWAGSIQNADGKQEKPNLGGLIRLEPAPDMRFPHATSERPFDRLKRQLKAQVAAEYTEKGITLSEEHLALRLRSAILALDLGDEDPRGPGKPKPPRPRPR